MIVKKFFSDWPLLRSYHKSIPSDDVMETFIRKVITFAFGSPKISFPFLSKTNIFDFIISIHESSDIVVLINILYYHIPVQTFKLIDIAVEMIICRSIEYNIFMFKRCSCCSCSCSCGSGSGCGRCFLDCFLHTTKLIMNSKEFIEFVN